MSTPVGKYRTRACGFDFGTSTKKGTPFVAVSFLIAGNVETWNGYLTEAAAKRTVKALRLMGWQGSDLDAVTLADLPGYVQVDVWEDLDEHKEPRRDKEGRTITRIAFINSLSGLFGPPMSGDARKALSLKLRGIVAAAPVVAPTLDSPEDDPGFEPGALDGPE